MFNIGFTELLILGILGLLIIGPEQLPDLARKLARILNDLKRAKDEIMSPVEEFKSEAERFVSKTRESLHETMKEAEKSVEASADKPAESSVPEVKKEDGKHEQ